MKTTKKNKKVKLLVQVGLMTVPLFIIMIAAVALSMYRSTVDSFLEAQNGYMTSTLNSALSKAMFSDDSYMYDYLVSHPDLVRNVGYTDEGLNEEYLSELKERVLRELGYDSIDQVTVNMFANGGEWNTEWIKEQSETVQEYCALMFCEFIRLLQDIDSNNKDYASLFLMDITPPNEGFVFFELKNTDGNRILGDRLDIDISEHPALEQVIQNCSDEVVFEKTEDFVKTGSQYIGYKPILIGGKPRVVLGIAYNWSTFQDNIRHSTNKAVMIGIGCIVVVMAALLVLLYGGVIKPVGRLQKSVRDYMGTKDSGKVTKDLSRTGIKNEIGLLSDDFVSLVKEIDDYTDENIRLAGEKQKAATELNMASSIQMSQLPSTFPAFPDRDEFDIYASMTPAKEVGGDFYDFFLVDDDHLALAIADVSDKGVPAALFMMMSRMLINTFASMGLEPAEVLKRTNEKLCESNSKMFVTVWFGILEISSGKITAVNAGHEYPIIRQPGGSFELFKDKHCFVAGGRMRSKYTQYEFTLQRGGTLFVYTDGIPEASRSEEEMFGTERLTEVLDLEPDAAPKQVIENVSRAVSEFVGNAPQFDDMTMLCIKLK